MSTYLRSRDGKTIHLAGCKRAGKTPPPAWNYAEGMDADALVTVLAQYPWLKPCAICRPDRSTT